MKLSRLFMVALLALSLAAVPLSGAGAAPVISCDNDSIDSGGGLLGAIRVPSGSTCLVENTEFTRPLTLAKGATLVIEDSYVPGIRGVGNVILDGSYVNGDVVGSFIVLSETETRGGVRANDLIAVDSPIGGSVNVQSRGFGALLPAALEGLSGIGALMIDSELGEDAPPLILADETGAATDTLPASVGGDFRQTGGLLSLLAGADVAGTGSVRSTQLANLILLSEFGRSFDTSNNRGISLLLLNSVVGDMSVSRQSGGSITLMLLNSVSRSLSCYRNGGFGIVGLNTYLSARFDCAPEHLNAVAEAEAAAAEHGAAGASAAESKLDQLAGSGLLDAEASAAISAAADQVAAEIGL